MRLGFLHLGESEHGVCRYGRILAAEARRRPALEVVEAACFLAPGGADAAGAGATADREGAERLEAAARQLSGCDVVHVQHSPGVWGGGWAQVRHVQRFLGACSAPLVATLHDVYPGDTWKLWRTRRRGPLRWLRGQRRELERGWPGRRASAALLARAHTVLVCSQQERARLRARSRAGGRLECIPHFVEERGTLPDRDEARRDLGVEGRRVVTLLGFIHPSKGHSLLVRALRRLPDDVLAVLAGRPSPGNEAFLDSLRERARADGSGDRLHVTGYLADDEQERWLVATDLAVAPFRYFSASGSLSTWISAARPLLASALPQIEEYDEISPGAIATFAPYRARALASAIREELARAPEGPDPAVARLRDQLLVPRIFDCHLEVYERAAGRPG